MVSVSPSTDMLNVTSCPNAVKDRRREGGGEGGVGLWGFSDSGAIESAFVEGACICRSCGLKIQHARLIAHIAVVNRLLSL